MKAGPPFLAPLHCPSGSDRHLTSLLSFRPQRPDRSVIDLSGLQTALRRVRRAQNDRCPPHRSRLLNAPGYARPVRLRVAATLPGDGQKSRERARVFLLHHLHDRHQLGRQDHLQQPVSCGIRSQQELRRFAGGQWPTEWSLGEGESWHYKYAWVGECGAYGDPLPNGGYCIWGQFEVIMSHGTVDGQHFWDARANPAGYGFYP